MYNTHYYKCHHLENENMNQSRQMIRMYFFFVLHRLNQYELIVLQRKKNWR